jgi:lipopolysaccharide export LptBFGC system permease protein LptF
MNEIKLNNQKFLINLNEINSSHLFKKKEASFELKSLNGFNHNKELISKNNKFENFIIEFDKLQQNINELINDVIQKDGINIKDLISLQQEIHKISHSIELASKLIDQAINALRTTLQQQL